MFKKFFAVLTAAVLTVCLAGCSEYVMTEDDLAIYESIQGYWAADVGTGYNVFDEDGTLISMSVVEFTDDFNYLIHICYVKQGYALSYPPTKYSFEDKLFKVMTDGVASYAQLSVSDDGQTLYWHTDNKTDTYIRIEQEEAKSLGIPEYSAESWVTDENGSFVNETGAEVYDTEDSDTGASDASDTEDNAAAQAAVNSYGQSKLFGGADIDPAALKFDKSVKFDLENYDYENVPVFLAETEDGEAAVYGMYPSGKEPCIFIEHDGVVDVFEQNWLTPRNILPIFMHEDIDGDGEKELAAAYYTGSGTGISVAELVFYELRDGHYKSYAYDPIGFLEDVVTADIDNEAHTVTFTLTTNGESVSYDTSEDYPDGIDRIGWGSNIGYEFDGNDVILTAHPSVNLFYECMPKITAKVWYW
ncbi:MAG: YgdI/YgdR family lipoprotein, partial [Oscillospiraceae bacterium]|nr:YgdI/YgdR family lipoprotein [Oscillospiraceae bacterium]